MIAVEASRPPFGIGPVRTSIVRIGPARAGRGRTGPGWIGIVTQPFRVAEGGRVDRTRPVHFLFDSQHYEGFAGDTLASALLANGVHLVGRSFKYHRPRGHPVGRLRGAERAGHGRSRPRPR